MPRPPHQNRPRSKCPGRRTALVEIEDFGFGEGSAVEPGGVIPEFEAPLREPVGGFGVDAVFDGLDALHELVGIVSRGDADPALQDARAAVEFLGDEMHGAAMELVAGIQDSLVGVEARVEW